jgi:hypothetical protein
MAVNASGSKRATYAHSNADENHSKALPEHKPHDFASAGSKRNAHAHFRYTLRSSFVAQRYHRSTRAARRAGT